MLKKGDVVRATRRDRVVTAHDNELRYVEPGDLAIVQEVHFRHMEAGTRYNVDLLILRLGVICPGFGAYEMSRLWEKVDGDA